MALTISDLKRAIIQRDVEISRLRAVLEDFAAETEKEFIGDGEHDTKGGWVERPTRKAEKARAALDLACSQ